MQSVAWAQGFGGGGSSSSTFLSLIPFVLIFVIFYFLVILPQQKRTKQQKALLEALKKGDKVVTASGIWGTVTNLGKETVTLQIADSTKIRMQRDQIARLRGGDDEDKDKDFVRKLYANVPVLDTGARGATTTFVQRGIGDVFISWENEALLAVKEFGADKFEIIVPSLSILAEPTVTVVDRVVKKRGTEAVAQAYLQHLYSEEGQDIAGKHFYRPRSEKAVAKYASVFPKIELFTIDEAFGGWTKAKKVHFAEGGLFDQIFKPSN